jgi:membrane protease YdiL (CAAX protease family)
MACEALLLGTALLIAAELQGTALRHVLSWEGKLPSCTIRGDSLGSVVAFAGAGVYEEALFRLALLPLVMGLAVAAGTPRGVAVASAVLATSLAFAGAHHLGPCGEALEWPAFVFRTAAGGLFAAVYLYRGFGIAAGMHVSYDILVAIV